MASYGGDIRGHWFARLGASLAMLALVPTLASADAKQGNPRLFVDSSSRRVTVPEHIDRVYAAGPPAAIMLYMLAPQKLIGWTRSLSAAERLGLPAAATPPTSKES
jgi:iron complex transport system substrate-binding protein